MKQVIISGSLIRYADEGSGDVILMLHGWNSHAGTFDQLASALSGSQRVIRPDLPGFGGSQVPQTALSVSNFAEIIHEFCKKLKIEPNVIIGHSLGGRIALKGVSVGLFKPKRLILLASAGIRSSDSVRNQSYKAVAKIGKTVTSLPGIRAVQPKLRRALYRQAGATDYLEAGPMRDTFIRVINEDLRPDAEQVKVPTLLLYGDGDEETPLHDAKLLSGAIKDSRLEVLASAGHYVFLDKPTESIKLIQEFIR